MYFLFREVWAFCQLTQKTCSYTCFDIYNITFISISRSLRQRCQGKREREIPKDKLSSQSPGMKTHAHILHNHDTTGILWVILSFLRAKRSNSRGISYNTHSKTVVFFVHISQEKWKSVFAVSFGRKVSIIITPCVTMEGKWKEPGSF